MLANEQAPTASAIAIWANELIGKEVPDAPGYRVVHVIQFQLITLQNGYAALLLAEVTDTPPETQIAFKEEDIVVIEQLTASIGETSEDNTPLLEG